MPMLCVNGLLRNPSSYPFNSGCGALARQVRQGVEDDVPVPGLGLGRVEDGAVAVHEHHGRGEVEDARAEDEDVVGEVVGLAHHQAVRVEVEARRGEDHQRVEGE